MFFTSSFWVKKANIPLTISLMLSENTYLLLTSNGISTKFYVISQWQKKFSSANQPNTSCFHKRVRGACWHCDMSPNYWQELTGSNEEWSENTKINKNETVYHFFIYLMQSILNTLSITSQQKVYCWWEAICPPHS